MKFLNCVGLTGVDDYTDIYYLKDMYFKYPFLEYGIGFDTPNSTNIRYSGYRILGRLQKESDIPWVAHLSEKNVEITLPFILKGEVPEYLNDVPWRRIQINLQINCDLFHYSQHSAQDFLYRISEWGALFEVPCNIILPETRTSRSWFKTLIIPNNIDILNDESGGRGIAMPIHERSLPYHSRFGYAGGISLKNIENSLIVFSKNFQQSFIKNNIDFSWIDMETCLRNEHGMFDIEYVENILKKALPFIK